MGIFRSTPNTYFLQLTMCVTDIFHGPEGDEPHSVEKGDDML